MDTDEVIWIIVAVAVVLALAALAWFLLKRQKQRRDEERRTRAAELRDEAGRHARVLPDAELRAQEERLKAEKTRLDAERAQVDAERAQERAEEAETRYLQQEALQEDRLREADKLDPDHGSVPPGQGRHTGRDDGRRDPDIDTPPPAR